MTVALNMVCLTLFSGVVLKRYSRQTRIWIRFCAAASGKKQSQTPRLPSNKLHGLHIMINVFQAACIFERDVVTMDNNM